jgi:Domain of unknown function (DUF5666)
MKLRSFAAIVLSLAFTAAASAQNEPTAPPTGQSSDAGSGGLQGQDRDQGQRGGRGGGFGMGMGRGVLGTVTEVSADRYTIKTDAGETYIVHFSVNTRILRQSAQRRGQGAEGGNPPQSIKPADIKVGDAIAASGEVDATAKSVGAVFILQIDPERARQMRAMHANYGKTWLAGKVTAIDGVNVTLLGINDHIAHTFAADENTTFRKRREPITLADIQVGDTIRVEGAVKDGTFLATAVVAIGRPPEGTATVPRNTPPQ